METPIRVVLVDDHRLLRAGLRMLLEAKPRITVVGEASDGLEALALLRKVTADVVVMDLSMPNMDGIECIKEIKKRDSKARIIVLTMYEDETYIREVMRAGAMAYIQKNSVDQELFAAITTVYSGKMYLNQHDTQALLSLLLHDDGAAHPVDDPLLVLSAREREVLTLLVYGYSNGEIAAKLALSAKTVETYKARIMEKLHFNHKSEMVDYALKHHLLG